MKALLHYIWKYRIFPHRLLQTTGGATIEILNNGNERPDIFEDAHLMIDGKEKRGDITFCITGSGADKAILNISATEEACPIPTLKIVPTAETTAIFQSIQNGFCPCSDTLPESSTLHMGNFLSRLLAERMEEKAARITRLHNLSEKRWEETLFRLLARNFGFGIQGDAFEEWAKVLNLSALGKHRDNPLQTEAIFFGQAGLLEEESIPEYYRTEALGTPYYTNLRNEYKFLKAKFGLAQTPHTLWTGTTPHTRIARLAAMYHSGKISLSHIADCTTLEAVRNLLQTPAGSYWDKHNQFGGTEINNRATTLSNKHLNLLTINTIIPILYTYGKHRSDTNLCNRAEDFLYSLPPEENSIIRSWAKTGIIAKSAADTQALIQLKNQYCKKNRCLECLFAYQCIKESMGHKS